VADPQNSAQDNAPISRAPRALLVTAMDFRHNTKVLCRAPSLVAPTRGLSPRVPLRRRFQLKSHTKRNAMRIYVFKSVSTERLRAFASDPDVNNLPRQHGPWVITGAIAPGATPPHNFAREAIEKAITASGFQLWRLRDGAEAQT
jgi:hypothetical protein